VGVPVSDINDSGWEKLVLGGKEGTPEVFLEEETLPPKKKRGESEKGRPACHQVLPGRKGEETLSAKRGGGGRESGPFKEGDCA